MGQGFVYSYDDPCTLKTNEIYIDNQTHIIGWLTCFWVNEEYKSQNVAANLFLRAIRAYNKNIFIIFNKHFILFNYYKTFTKT